MIDSYEKYEFEKDLNEIIKFLYSDNNSNYKAFKKFIESFCKKYFHTINEIEVSHFLKEIESLKIEENFTPKKKKEIATKLSVFFKSLEDGKEEKISVWRRFVNFILSLFRSNPKPAQMNNIVAKTTEEEVAEIADLSASQEIDRLAEALKLALAESFSESEVIEQEQDTQSIVSSSYSDFDLDSEFDSEEEVQIADATELKHLLLNEASLSAQAQEIIFGKLALALAEEFSSQFEDSGYEGDTESNDFTEENAQAADATELKCLLAEESSLLSAPVKDFIFECLRSHLAEEFLPEIEINEQTANEAELLLAEIPAAVYAEIFAEIPSAIYASIYAGIYAAITEERDSIDADPIASEVQSSPEENASQEVNAVPTLNLDISIQTQVNEQASPAATEEVKLEEEAPEPQVSAEITSTSDADVPAIVTDAVEDDIKPEDVPALPTPEEPAEVKENGSQEISTPEASKVSTVTIEEDEAETIKEETPASVELVEEKSTEEEIESEGEPALETLVELALVSELAEVTEEKEEALKDVIVSPITVEIVSVSDAAESTEIKENGLQEISTSESSEDSAVTIEEETPISVEPVKEEEVNVDVTLASQEPAEPSSTAETDAAAIITKSTEEEIKPEDTLTSLIPAADESVPQASSKKTAAEPEPIIQTVERQEEKSEYEALFPKCVVKNTVSKSDSFMTASTSDAALAEAKEEEKVKREVLLELQVSSVSSPISAESKAEPIPQIPDKKGVKPESKSLFNKLTSSLLNNKKKAGRIITSEEVVEKEENEITGTDFVKKAIVYAVHLHSLRQAKKESNKPEIERIKRLIETNGKELLALLRAQQAVAGETKLESSNVRKEIEPLVNKAIELTNSISALHRAQQANNRTIVNKIKKLIKTKGKELIEIYSENNSRVVSRASSSQSNDEKGLQSGRKSESSLFKVPHKKESAETNNKGIGLSTYRF